MSIPRKSTPLPTQTSGDQVGALVRASTAPGHAKVILVRNLRVTFAPTNPPPQVSASPPDPYSLSNLLPSVTVLPAVRAHLRVALVRALPTPSQTCVCVFTACPPKLRPNRTSQVVTRDVYPEKKHTASYSNLG